MMPYNRPPGGPPGGRVPPHLGSPSQVSLLQNRVAEQYGAFGERNEEEEVDERSLSDNWWKQTAKIIIGVFLASCFLSFVSHPTFNGPSVWAESVRLDTVFV